MSNYRGFALAKLVRAVTDGSPDSNDKPYSYEVNIYSKVSPKPLPKNDFLPVHKINGEFGRWMRMEEGKSRYAVMRGGSTKWEPISEEEFNSLLTTWENALN